MGRWNQAPVLYRHLLEKESPSRHRPVHREGSERLVSVEIGYFMQTHNLIVLLTLNLFMFALNRVADVPVEKLYARNDTSFCGRHCRPSGRCHCSLPPEEMVL